MTLTDEQLAEIKTLLEVARASVWSFTELDIEYASALLDEVERLRALELERSNALTEIAQLGQEIDND